MLKNNCASNINENIFNLSMQKRLHELFQEQCSQTPYAEALKFENNSISYQELNERSNQISYYLREQGIKRDELVIISMNRSIELVIGLFAVLKAGGAYVPVDPNYPEERMKYIAKDSQAKIFIVDKNIEHKFSHITSNNIYIDKQQIYEKYSRSNPVNINSADDLCYVIYTSGSTGNPKGVGNVHKGVVNRILWMQDQYKLTCEDRVIQKTPFGFDVSVWEFFWPLTIGASLVMAAPETHKDAYELASLIEKQRITIIHFVPSMLSLFLEANISNKCFSLKRVFVSGEALSYSVQNKFFKQFNCGLYNLYGPTEAAIDVSYWECRKDDRRITVPIGYPIANIYLYILNENLQSVEQGEIGELFIGGIGLARGYLNKETLTKEKFISNPFIHSDIIYHTGDICRFLDDGAIEYIGRADNQIKLRGFRIEIGEIENIIFKNPDIRNVAVVVREEIPNQKYLVAYLLANNKSNHLKQELKKSIKNTLPEYMLPSFFVFLDEFPLNPNGKLDIKRLEKPDYQEQKIDFQCGLPKNLNEVEIQKIWSEILGLKEIGVTVSFFSIGGHSLQAMSLVLKIRQKLKKIISLAEIFDYNTIELQANIIEKRTAIDNSSKNIEHDPIYSLEPFQLTDIQKAYLLGRGDAFALGGIRSHIYIENEVDNLDIIKLETALNILIKRHGALRLSFLDDGTQQTTNDINYYTIEINNTELQKFRAEKINSFKLNKKNVCFDISVTKMKDHKYIVHFCFDLLITDATGLEIIFNELSYLYQSKLPIRLAPEVSYRDAIVALSQLTDKYEIAKEYWFNRIDSLPEAPKLPLVKVKNNNNSEFTRRKFFLPSTEWNNLQKIAAQIGITPAVLLITVYGEVIKNWTDSSHFTLNLMFFNRPQIHADINNIVGNFSTTLLLEMNLVKYQSFIDKARFVQKQLLSDLEHSEFNGIKVLNEINRRKGSYSSASMPVVFACALNVKSSHPSEDKNLFKWYGSNVRYSHLETPQVLLDHQVFEDDDGALHCIWDARESYFPKGLIDNMIEYYNNFLVSISHEKMSKISLIPDKDLQLIHEINNNFIEKENEFLHMGIVQYAMLNPAKLALLTENISISYKQLVSTSSNIKRKLTSLGIGQNDFVAIIMEKGWEQVVASIAIVSIGAVYIPIDVILPEIRIKQILDTSRCRAILLKHDLDFNLKTPQILVTEISNEGLNNLDLNQTQSPDDLAYVIFTSGSTGIPKGVMISHKAAMNTIRGINQKYDVTNDDIIFAVSSFSFDLSVYDIFGLLNVGGTLYIPTALEVKNPESWINIVESRKITIWNSAPALMQIFMEEVSLRESIKGSKLRYIFLSGDWIPLWLPEQIKHYFNATVISLGGATEASIWSNYYEIDEVDSEWSSIPYGRPLSNQNMFILDECLDYRAVLATGLIYIGGKSLANGYLNDPKKTEESFIWHPRLNKTLYCTGDLGRLCFDGNIEFLGRKDLQVKIQGYRIELGDIESSLTEIGEVKQAIVRVIGNKVEDKKIIAFFTADKNMNGEEIKALLAKKIPAYMIPSFIFQIKHFPLTTNGKINVNELISKFDLSSKITKNNEDSESITEKKIEAIWSKLLNVEKLSRNDNFFEVGGTSFLAFQLVHQIKKDFGYSLSLTTMFQKGSIKKIAEDLDQVKNEFSSPLVALQEEGSHPPIFFIHPSGGGVLCYTDLVKTLGNNRPFYGIQHPSYLNNTLTDFSTLESLAHYYTKVILDKCSDGNCWIGGWSFGGVVAFEIANQFKGKGIKIRPLILIDSPSPAVSEIPADSSIYSWFKEDYGTHYLSLDDVAKQSLFGVFKNNIKMLMNYKPTVYQIDLIQFKAKHVTIDQLKNHSDSLYDDWGWSKFSSGNIYNFVFDADHASIIQYPNLSILSQKISQFMQEAK